MFDGKPVQDRQLDAEDRTPLAKQKPYDHFKRRLEDSLGHCRKAWDRARENHRFVRGGRYQWPGDDYDARNKDGRGAFSHNDISPVIAALAGRQITERLQSVFKGRMGMGDDAFAEIVQEVSRHFRDRGTFESVVSRAFRNLHISAYSWTERFQDLMFRPIGIGRNRLEYIKIWEMVWDRHADDWNLRDREWDARGRYISYEAAIGRFPLHEKKIHKLTTHQTDAKHWVTKQAETTNRWPWVSQAKGRYHHKRRGAVFLVDYHYRQRGYVYLVTAPDPGFLEDPDLAEFLQERSAQYDPEDLSDLVRQLTQDTADLELNKQQLKLFSELWERAYNGPLSDDLYEPVPQWEYWRTEFIGGEELRTVELPPRRFQRQCMTGIPFEEPGQTEFYATVDLMRDPQKFKNMIYAMIFAMMQRSPKSALFYEPGTFAKPAQVTSQLTKPFALIPMKRGGIKQIEWAPDLRWPPGLDSILGLAKEAVWAPLGMNPSALGQVPDLRRVSGEAFQKVVDTVFILFSQFFESLRLWRQESGELDLGFMQHLPREHIVRIVGEEAAYGPPIYVDQDGQEITEEELQAAVDPETGEPTVQVQELTGADKPPDTWPLPPKEQWSVLEEFDVIAEVGPAGGSRESEIWDFGTRDGLFRWLLESGQLPLELFVGWMPHLTETERDRWFDHLKQQQQAAALEEPAPEEEEY